MKEFTINENEAGQRFDKYLAKRLKLAPKSFFYKMLRKKNITLNGRKAAGSEILVPGDTIKFFLSDETFQKFEGEQKAARATTALDILYEDTHVLLVNKPVGILSQPDDSGKPSMVEYIIGYLLESGTLTEEDLKTFRPSVSNRLDRNTSGILAAGKSLAGLQMLSEIFRDRTVKKEYLCLVQGVISTPCHISGYLLKDEKQNKVSITKNPAGGAKKIETLYTPLGNNGKITLLSVELLTGRTHQIRVHLASAGHPLAGDTKYGSPSFNRYLQTEYRLHSQLLHAYKITFPQFDGRKFTDLSGKVFTAPVPERFLHILREEHLEEIYNENME